MSEQTAWVIIILCVVIMIAIGVIFAPEDNSGMPQ